MFLLTSVYKILVCALAFIIVVVLMLLSAKFFWHFYLAEPPHMLISLLRNLNSQFSSGRLEDIQAWIQTAEWLQADTRNYVAGLLHIRVRVTGVETLGIAEIIPNLLGMASFGAFVSFVPLLFLTIAILQIVSLPTTQLGAWALVALLLAAPFGLIFSAFGLVAAFAFWIIFLFNDMTLWYSVLWLLLGLHALGLGIAAGIGLMTIPFALAAGSNATGLVADVRNTLLSVLARLLQALTGGATWLHYFFVPHPAAKGLKGAHGRVDPQPINTRDVFDEVKKQTKADQSFWFWFIPGFVARNMAQKAKAHKERLHAEAEMLDAAIKRERAREQHEREKTANK